MNAVTLARRGGRRRRRRPRTHAETAGARTNWPSPRGGVFNTTLSTRNEVAETATRVAIDPRFNCVQQPPADVEQLGGAR